MRKLLVLALLWGGPWATAWADCQENDGLCRANCALAANASAVQTCRTLCNAAQQVCRAQAAREEQEEQDRRAQEQDRRAREAQERAAAQQAAEQREQQSSNARAALRAENDGLLPPQEYAGRIVLHKRLLAGALPDPVVVVSTRPVGVAVSKDAALAAAVLPSGDMLLYRLGEGATARTIAHVAGSAYPQFFATRWIFVNDPSSNTGELYDLDGHLLQRWANVLDVRGPGEDGRTDFALAFLQPLKGDNQNGKYELRRCTGVAWFDTTGEKLAEVDLARAPVDQCLMSYVWNERREILTFDRTRQIATFYANGARVREFKNVSTAALLPAAQGETYVVTAGTLPATDIWRPGDGKQICHFDESLGTLVALPDVPIVYSVTNPGVVDLAACTQRTLGGPDNQLIWDGKRIVVFNRKAAQVATFDLQGGKSGSSFDLTGTVVTDNLWVRPMQGRPGRFMVWQGYVPPDQRIPPQDARVYDSTTGQLVRTLPRGYFYGRDIYLADRGTSTAIYRQVDLPEVAGFVDALAKDKYETTAAYRTRVGTLRVPMTLRATLGDYDADAGQFQARWNGARFSIPVTPAAARQLDGQQTLTLQGKLHPLDDSFVELASPSALMPDGSTLKLQVASGDPVSAPQKPVIAAAQGAAPTPAAAPNAKPNAALNTATAATQPGASCHDTLGFLAARIPEYRDPRLNAARQSIITDDVRKEMQNAKAQGFTGPSFVKALLEDARALEESMKQGAQCASQVSSFDIQDEQFLQKIKSGPEPANCASTSIVDSCVCLAFMYRLSALGQRAIAAEAQCFIRAGAW